MGSAAQTLEQGQSGRGDLGPIHIASTRYANANSNKLCKDDIMHTCIVKRVI